GASAAQLSARNCCDRRRQANGFRQCKASRQRETECAMKTVARASRVNRLYTKGWQFKNFVLVKIGATFRTQRNDWHFCAARLEIVQGADIVSLGCQDLGKLPGDDGVIRQTQKVKVGLTGVVHIGHYRNAM